ncbi:unnamed protein product [Diamesa serratosioi]
MDISGSFRAEDLSKTDFFDFVSAPPEVENEPATQSSTISEQQPLQGFDQVNFKTMRKLTKFLLLLLNFQFWGAEKETHRLETAIFDDLNRYCWNQQSNNLTTTNSPSSSSQVVNPDGQIYTITVLNSSSTDQWLRKDITNNADHPHGLDLDTILSYYPNVKTECFSYDDSGFGTDHTKEDVNYQNPPPPPPPPQNLQQSSGIVTTTTTTATDNILLESNLNNNILSYTDNTNNNNNEWHLDRNEESPESLLRSALQGKGYSKTLQTVQNGITLISAQNSTKDEELRRVLFPNDQETLSFADSTLTNSLFDDSHIPQSTTHQSGVIVDDMFLTLDSAFNDDFEKIKRIASEYKKSINNNNNNNTNNLNNNNSSTINNNLNDNNKSMNNNMNANQLHSINSNSNSNSTASTNGNSATLCNGQRKERSLHYCSICSKGFKDKYSVNVHIRTHTGEKPFACSLCGKSFRQKAHLAKHYQTHLAAKNANGGNMKPSKMHQKNSLVNNNNNNNSNNNNNNSNNNNNTTQGQPGSIPSQQMPINIIAGR